MRTDDIEALVDLAQSLRIDLVVVGPEAPLVAGLADELRKAGIATFGPSAAAAQIEGSKAFAKDVLDAAGVPTARILDRSINHLQQPHTMRLLFRRQRYCQTMVW